MSKLIIEGGQRLFGEIPVHGAKNSALPILAAAFVCDGVSIIHNTPELSDVTATVNILKHLGCKVTREGGTVTVDARDAYGYEIPVELMREMRSSIVFLGAVAARVSKARLSFPGGCELGPRPIDLHLSSLKQLGLSVDEERGYLDCEAKEGLTGCEIRLPIPSVGATENIMLAASTAKGKTVIHNAAREPEISDLADFLNRAGAKIRGAGESEIIITGVKKLNGAEHTVIPDRIAACTYLMAGAVTRGDVTLRKTEPEHNMAALADGTSMFVENIFDNRYRHAGELARMGAKIKVEGKVAVVEGVSRLSGAEVESTDLRGGAALIVAALGADGQTAVGGLKHVDRGYDDIEGCLKRLGARITYEKTVTKEGIVNAG